MKNNTKFILWTCLVCIIVIVSLFLNWYLLYNNSDRGTFGDMFGVANALFSGLAFGGIIYTILLQRDDLKRTKEEFRIQQFETNLSNLINSHLKIVEQLSVKDDNGTYIKGREVFRIMYETKKLNNRKISFNERYDIGHYFRHIYRILKVISREKLKATKNNVDQEMYYNSNLLRSLLSSYELKCILFWCIQEDDNQLIEYINEFSLFKDLSEDLKDITLHHKLKKQAFYTKKV